MKRYGGWFHESFRHSLAARGVRTGKGYMAAKDRATSRFDFSAVRRFFKKDEAETPVSDVKKGTEKVVAETLAAGPGAVGSRRPREPLERFRTGLALEKDIEDYLRSRRSVDQAIEYAGAGSVALALKLLSEGKNLEGQNLTTSEREALQSSLNAFAVRQAQAGLPVPEQVEKMLDKSVLRRVGLLQTQAARELESPLRKELREDVQKAAIAAVEAPVRAVGAAAGAAAGATAEGLRGTGGGEEQKFTGVSGQIDRLEKTPPFEPVGEGGANAFIDDKGKFGDFDTSGKLGDFGGAFSGISPGPAPLGSFGPLVGGGNTNPVFRGSNNVLIGGSAQKQTTFSEEVSKKVDSDVAQRAKLSEVDLQAFDEGKRAFKKGDREKLIGAIGELQSQEAKLRDRWALVGQTHAQVVSVQNHESAYGGESGNIVFGSGSGAAKIADQTEKLNDVRGEILKANNKVFARRRMLEYDLQRMDASVPPVRTVPGKVMRFDEEKRSSVSGFFRGALKDAVPVVRGADDGR